MSNGVSDNLDDVCNHDDVLIATNNQIIIRLIFRHKANHFNLSSCCRFSLSPSEVGSKMEGVPIKETMLSDMCPDIESAFCFPHKYRTINGECNNVKNPTWGITGAAYLRILEPTYQDGKWERSNVWVVSIRK